MASKQAVDPVRALEGLAAAAMAFRDFLTAHPNLAAEATPTDAQQIAEFFRRLAAAGRALEAWRHQLERGL